MNGFKKIDLEKGNKSQKQDETSDTKRKLSFIKNKKLLLKIASILVLILVLTVVFVVLPLQRTYVAGMAAYKSARMTAAYAKAQDIEQASLELENTKKLMAKTQDEFKGLIVLKYIPVVNWYHSDMDNLLKAGEAGINTGEVLLDSIKPYADVLGLKGAGTFAGGSAEDRIRTAVLTMGKVTPRIDEISKNLLVVREHVNKVNPDHYPSLIFGKKIHDTLSQFRDLTDQGVTFVDQARPLIKVLPSLLGEKNDKKYLILFQNDAELRPTGGFITAYSVFRIEKGVIHVDKSDDIYKLDDSISGKGPAAEPIKKYLPKVYVGNLRDSNLSPDFIVSMNDFLKLYNRASQKSEIDGIIALDTNVLVSVIKILDDEIYAGGLKFTSKNDPRCDCPQVIYELEDNISRPVNYIKEGRKDLLGILLYALMDKALKSSPKQYWGPLFQDLLAQINQKHVMFYLFDKDAQSGIEALNAAGRIKDFEGDYLHINDTNFAGAKSNLFTSQQVDVSYNIKSDGLVEKTMTIVYKNTHEPSDCNLERGGLCLNAPLRNWLRIYVPKGSRIVSSSGSEVKMMTKTELGKTLFEGFLTVRPLGKATFTITYELPFKIQKGSSLPFLIQKQPGTKDPEYSIKVNGRTINKFPLLTDKELKLRI